MAATSRASPFKVFNEVLEFWISSLQVTFKQCESTKFTARRASIPTISKTN